MPAYVTIANSDILPEAPITSELMTAMRDNPLSIQQVDSNAPLSPGVWHPYDMVNVGDGATGVIYDQTVDGNVNEVVSPDFEDLYEYMFLFSIACNIQGSVSNGTFVEAGLNIDLYRETDAAYSTASQLLDSDSSGSPISLTARLQGVYGPLYVKIPRITKKFHPTDGDLYALRLSRGDGVVSGSGGVYDTTDQKILKARFQRYGSSNLSGNINGGTIKMFRRRIAVE